MKLLVDVDCDTLGEDRQFCEEISRILKHTATNISFGMTQGFLKDSQGKIVGRFELKEEEKEIV